MLNVDPRAIRSDAYIKISNATDLAGALLRYTWNDWSVHVHINGHTRKSWIIALAAGLACQNGSRGILTIHSGIAPHYLGECSPTDRILAQLAAMQFDRVVCVNEEIAGVFRNLNIPSDRIAIIPAFLPVSSSSGIAGSELDSWIASHSPLLSTALFFRPEYGFELLLAGVKELVTRHPGLGCIVMGSGEEQMAAEVLTKREGLSESIRFLGDVDHDACLALMARSNVFVRPTFRDGDSISVREAVSLGIPVVASNVGTRPPEALLFEAGHVGPFVAQVEHALTNISGLEAQSHNDTIEQLLQVYSALKRER